MNSRIPARPVSTPSQMLGSSLDEGAFTERGLLERCSGSGYLRSSLPTPPKFRSEGEIEKVKVYARIRPALRDDETPGALVWSEDGGQLTIFRPEAPVPQSDFAFDKVLGPSACQADVYNAAVADVVADVLRGYNGTILAYGQTGAGKTFTLGNTTPDAIGMIPRAAAELFSAASRDAVHVYRITMSYIQIYMEMIQDLLNPTADNLPIREDAGGVFVAGACEVPVNSLEECLHYLELGEQNRVFAFTHLNAHSSRSHAVVMLTVVKSRKYLSNEERAQAEAPDQDGVVTQKVTVGKLYMVDLAGSERLKKSKSVGLRATEARSINLSLTMLGMCISARAQDSQHVPFRDSKLTRLLQESLGGNAKTSLILCLSDVRQHADESLQSLQFGSRASRVCNKPVVNERLQMRQLTAELLAALEEGNERKNGLEQALSQTKEERDALQAALARERARTAAIVDALRAEARVKDEQSAAKLAEQAELLSEHVQHLGQVQQQQGQLEMEVAKLRAEQHAREEVHRTEVAELQQRLVALQAAAAAERQAMEAEARSQQAQLAAAAHQQAAVLTSQLAQERAAAREQAASIHLALTRLQRALGELVSAPAPAEDGSGDFGSSVGGGAVHSNADGAVKLDDGVNGGRLPQRPVWTKAGLAAAAVAAANRRGMSSGGGYGDGSGVSSGGGGGNSAVQMIQAALGLTGTSSDCEGSGDIDPAVASPLDDGTAGPTAAAIAMLVGGGSNAMENGCRLRQSYSMGAASSSPIMLYDQRSGGYRESGTGGMNVIVGAHARMQGRSASSSGSGLPPTAPSPQSAQPQPQPQQRSPVASAGCSSPSIGLYSSEIADIDAALAAAQQDLIADLHAVTRSGSGSGNGSASALPGRLLTNNAHNNPAWPLALPAVAADAIPTANVSGNARQPSPHGGNRGSINFGSGTNTSGSYAAEYATALAHGISSPGRQNRSYNMLHTSGGGTSGITAASCAVGKMSRMHSIHRGGSSDGTATGLGSMGRHGTSFCSGDSGAIPHEGLALEASSAAGPSMFTPFMDEGGRHAATAANPPLPSSSPRYPSRNSISGGDADAGMGPCSGNVNTNPAYDVCDSDGLKSEDMLAAMSAAGMSFASFAATTGAAAAGVGGPNSNTGADGAGAGSQIGGVLRERRASDAGILGGVLAPSPTLAGPPPPMPIFTGIQVQLDALMDIAAVLKRIKTGLEARVVAQTCELAWREQEQQQSRNELQAARTALNVAESQLANTTQELDAVRMMLAEAVDELGRTRQELDERTTDLDDTRRKLDDMAGLYDSALMRLGETRGRLDEALGQLVDQGQEVERLGTELELAKAHLVSERSASARARAASARSQAMTTQALTARHELQRQIRAANTIKAAFKRFKLVQLRVQVAAKHQALRDAESYRREREAFQAARAGQALVQESVGVIRDAVGSILAAFVGRRYQLEARKSLHDRLERMFSQGGSGNSKIGPSTAAKLPLAVFPSAAGRPISSAGGASSTGGAAGNVSRSVGGGIAPPLTPGGGRRQMSSPLGLTMMLSAVTLPPLTPASPSTTPSTSKLPASADGGGGGGGGVGGYGGYGTRRQGLLPSPLQLPDDTATSVGSMTPKKGPDGSGGGGGGGSDGPSSSAVGGAIFGSVKAGDGDNGGGGGGGGAAVHIPRTTYSTVAHSSTAGGGGAAIAVSTAAIVTVAVIPDPDDITTTPADAGPCSSSSSCSGAGAAPASSSTTEAMSKAANVVMAQVEEPTKTRKV